MSSDPLLAAAARWIATLPIDLQPVATAKAFPKIVNALAEHWENPRNLQSYLNKLLVGRRGRRRALPIRVSRELHALRAYHASLQESGTMPRKVR